MENKHKIDLLKELEKIVTWWCVLQRPHHYTHRRKCQTLLREVIKRNLFLENDESIQKFLIFLCFKTIECENKEGGKKRWLNKIPIEDIIHFEKDYSSKSENESNKILFYYEKIYRKNPFHNNKIKVEGFQRFIYFEDIQKQIIYDSENKVGFFSENYPLSFDEILIGEKNEEILLQFLNVEDVKMELKLIKKIRRLNKLLI